MSSPKQTWSYKVVVAPNNNPPIQIIEYFTFPYKGEIFKFNLNKSSGLILIKMGAIFYLFDLNVEVHGLYKFIQKYIGITENNITDYLFDSVHHILCLSLDNGLISIYYTPPKSPKAKHLYSMEGHNSKIISMFLTDQPYELLTLGDDRYVFYFNYLVKTLVIS